MKATRRYWPWAVATGLLLLGGAIGAFAPVREWAGAFENFLEHMNLVKGLLVFVAVSVVGTLLLVPAWIFHIAAGAVFGMGWGLLGAVASSALSALGAFLLARYVLRGPVERAARKNKAFKSVDKAVRRDPWKVVVLLRMSPVLPSGLKSYFLGLTRIEPLPYALASVLGMLPGLVVTVYLGHAGRDAFGGGGTVKWTLFAIGIAATVAMALIVGRAAHKRLGLGR